MPRGGQVELTSWLIGIVSAPLWDSETSTFAGLLTTFDYINLIQYYWQNPESLNRIDQFKLNSLRGELQDNDSNSPGSR